MIPCVEDKKRRDIVQYRSGAFGSPAILGSLGESSQTSRRKRGPVALRHWLWPVKPLSFDPHCAHIQPVSREMQMILIIN